MWQNITDAMDNAAGEKGFPASVTVTQEVEKRCKRMAEVLCDSHLLDIPHTEITALADKHGARGSCTTKPNVTKTILRAVAWKTKGKALGFDVVGLNDKLQPY